MSRIYILEDARLCLSFPAENNTILTKSSACLSDILATPSIGLRDYDLSGQPLSQQNISIQIASTYGVWQKLWVLVLRGSLSITFERLDLFCTAPRPGSDHLTIVTNSWRKRLQSPSNPKCSSPPYFQPAEIQPCHTSPRRSPPAPCSCSY